MSGASITEIAIGAAAGGVLKAVMSGMMQEEASTRLNRIPLALIRLATTRVPDELRAELAAEWTAVLELVLRGTEGMPLTKLWRGIRYASGLLLSAGLIGEGLADANSRSVPRPGGERAMQPRIVAELPDKPHPDHVLTWRQRKVLQVISGSVQRRGYLPSMREIGEAVGLTTTSSVSYQLSTLQRKEYLRCDIGRPPTVEVRLPAGVV
jgi:hypothetical protein